MSKITIIADMVAHDDQIDFVKSELLALVKLTHAEEGCVMYDLQQDNENPAHFIMLEYWETMELLEKHSSNTALKTFRQKTEKAFVSFTAKKMTHISLGV